MLRLPHELKTLFSEWLATHYPDRAGHVMSLVQQLLSGRDYDSRFGRRQIGQGALAEAIVRRFAIASRRHTLEHDERSDLSCTAFRIPQCEGHQFKLI